MRHGLFLVALALASSPAVAARAAAGSGTGGADAARNERRVVFLRFRGPGGVVARAAAMDGLGEETTVRLVPLHLVEAQKDLTGSAGQRAAQIGRRLDITALVRGRVRTVSGGFQAMLIVVSGRTGLSVGSAFFRAPTLLELYERLRFETRAKLRPLLDAAEKTGTSASPAVRAETEAEDEEEEEPPAAVKAPPRPQQAPGKTEETGARIPPRRVALPREEETEEGPGAPAAPALAEPAAVRAPAAATARAALPPPAEAGSDRCSILDFETGGGAMYRMFNYRDEQRGALRAYNLKRAPLARLEAAIYPLAGRRCGGAAVLGVRGAFEQMAPVTSQVADRRLETGAFAYQAELLARIPVGVFIFRPSVGYFARRYSVAGNVVPNVLYRSVGGDLQIELRARALRLELGGGGRLVVDAGQIESAAWFPEATARTYTGRARVGWALSGWLEVVAGADAEYSSFRFNVPASAAAGAGYPNGVASGAYDFYVRGLLALRGHIPPGSGSGSSRRPPE